MKRTGASAVSDERGFAFLDIIVAVAIFSLLATALLAAVRLGTQHVSRQADHLERSARLPSAQSFLRSQLAAAESQLSVDSLDGMAPFEGTAAAVTFVAPAPRSVPNGGLWLYTIAASQRKLVARWRKYEGMFSGLAGGAWSEGPAADSGEAVLLEGVDGCEIRYFGIVPPELEPRWHETWRSMQYLPSIIRFAASFADGTRMPALDVAPRLAPVARPGP